MRWCHAVQEAENLQLGFKLIWHAIDRQISLAYRFFHGSNEANERHCFLAQCLAQTFFSVTEVGRHDIFQGDQEAGTRGMKGESPTQWTGTNDSYMELRIEHRSNRVRRVMERLFLGEGVQHILRAGLCLCQMGRYEGALVVIQSGNSGKNAAQGDGNIVNVIHQADSFSGERHVGTSLEMATSSLSALGVGSVKARPVGVVTSANGSRPRPALATPAE